MERKFHFQSSLWHLAFQHICFVKFANVWWLSRKSELIKDISTYIYFPDFVDTHLITEKKQPFLSIVAGSLRTNQRKGQGAI